MPPLSREPSRRGNGVAATTTSGGSPTCPAAGHRPPPPRDHRRFDPALHLDRPAIGGADLIGARCFDTSGAPVHPYRRLIREQQTHGEHGVPGSLRTMMVPRGLHHGVDDRAPARCCRSCAAATCLRARIVNTRLADLGRCRAVVGDAHGGGADRPDVDGDRRPGWRAGVREQVHQHLVQACAITDHDHWLVADARRRQSCSGPATWASLTASTAGADRSTGSVRVDARSPAAPRAADRRRGWSRSASISPGPWRGRPRRHVVGNGGGPIPAYLRIAASAQLVAGVGDEMPRAPWSLLLPRRGSPDVVEHPVSRRFQPPDFGIRGRHSFGDADPAARPPAVQW